MVTKELIFPVGHAHLQIKYKRLKFFQQCLITFTDDQDVGTLIYHKIVNVFVVSVILIQEAMFFVYILITWRRAGGRSTWVCI